MSMLDKSLQEVSSTPWLWQQWLREQYQCRLVHNHLSNSGSDLEFDSVYSAYLFVFRYS